VGIIWLPGASGRMPLAEDRRSRRADPRSWSPRRSGRDAINTWPDEPAAAVSGISTAPSHTRRA
jgi:hypothetical protein